VDQYLIDILTSNNREARATARLLVQQARQIIRAAHDLREENQVLREQMWNTYEHCLRDMENPRKIPPQS
jgi:hypothetical protein